MVKSLRLFLPQSLSSSSEITMARVCIVPIILALSLTGSALGQANHHHFNVVVDDPKPDFQVTADSAYAKGNWVALDKQSEIPGIDTSEVTCIKSEKVCHEVQANLVDIGDGTFTLSGDAEDYPVVRWNKDEILAQYIGGVCRAANVIKFDLRAKKVYSLQTLTEPIESLHLPKLSEDMCKAIGMSLELHAPGVYHVGPTQNAGKR
jgi:hypothetical protein